MTSASSPGERPGADEPTSYDVLIVGAGLAGLYTLHRMRGLGLRARILEAADDVGGTWYWNAYPGARCDVESVDYSYSFSPELEQEWEWTERYPSQPKILAYIRHVAERLDLRRDITFGVRVESAEFDEADDRWTLTTGDGVRHRARWCVMALGTLSAPLDPPFDGLGDFAGEWYQTQTFPQSGVDFRGKRVGLIGTGSSGVQSAPVIAEQAAHLTVFQRTPNFSVPAHNRPLAGSELDEVRAGYRERREQQKYSAFGYADNIPVNDRRAADMTPQEQRAELERRWRMGGAPNFMTAFTDILTDASANEVVSQFVRDKIREVVDDPATAELLSPTDHPIATKRLCVDSGYYQTFNRDNVELVDIRSAPIVRIAPDGVVTEAGHYPCDVLVFALGYDALSGPLLRIDIRGRDGRKLRDEWAAGPRSYLGLAMAGFPNLFTVTGPHSPSVLAVMTVAIEQHVEWISDTIAHLERTSTTRIEASERAQADWVAEVERVGAGTLFGRADSYYMGANVPGKPRKFALYLGGFGEYRRTCDAVAERGYEGFVLS